MLQPVDGWGCLPQQPAHACGLQWRAYTCPLAPIQAPLRYFERRRQQGPMPHCERGPLCLDIRVIRRMEP
ncbi:Hypothetical protein RAK1035_3003 [Roseovarius sp. AK1035]|nr:Hypothetical protein RAK1035_3003 [Roseovarius sp. AK1035]VVT29894.1 hypothetical protein RV420_410157 [Roseovarius sp. EC-SD190]